MVKIKPVSELQNYGKPVYLSKNGYGVYSLRTMHDLEQIWDDIVHIAAS